MDIKKLLQVVTVARRGNFSRAAEELNITQPALSRSIAALEDQFGIRIFERGRKGARLTTVGAVVVTEAEEILRKVRAFDHNLRLYGSGDGGRIVFGMGPLISSMILPGLGRHLLINHPRLRVQTQVKPATTLLSELMEDRIELLFCADGQLTATEDISVETVGNCRLGMLVRGDHPLTRQGQIHTRDIWAFPLLSSTELSSQDHAKGGAFICDNYHILRDIALHSDGIWMSSPAFVQREIADGQLCEITPSDNTRPLQTDIVMIRRADCSLSPAARMVVDCAASLLAQAPEARSV